MNSQKLDRSIEYKGIVYQIIEILQSEMLLVVEKEMFEKGIHPMPVQIIPGE